MTDEEKAEMQQMRDLFAGIALPGVIAKSTPITLKRAIAIECYSIAEAMIAERTKRIELDSSTTNLPQNESIH